MAQTALLIFPHQLFVHHPGFSRHPPRIVLIEDNLFFGDPNHTQHFHKQKLWFHRTTMKRYAARLRQRNFSVDYVDHRPNGGTLKTCLNQLVDDGFTHLLVAEPHDDLLCRRLKRACDTRGLALDWLSSPMFLNTSEDNRNYRQGKKRWFMADFYKFQRRRFEVLMAGDKPLGGQWSFDKENRKKVPKKRLSQIPTLPQIARLPLELETREYVQIHYSDNPGRLDALIYPTCHTEAEHWLQRFLEERFVRFGDYEDALVHGETFLWHSVLTPMLNTGLLTPEQVLQATLKTAENSQVPLNSLEGFIRQILGWREFIRATYEDLGVTMRTTNHWNHQRRIPRQFYEASTGILPLDDVIQRVLETGYCHHIERLMVLGGFMFLCEFHPDEVYQWFMEMFVDSYDWVMVPNVYAMSQHAAGGLITTKPYFSGSAYLRKMGNFPPGPWMEIWDGLYWRWILKNMKALSGNPRWAMMCAMARKMDETKQKKHLHTAETFLLQLD
jgi:deoxyribodipyrimidine photolyase-related protein